MNTKCAKLSLNNPKAKVRKIFQLAIKRISIFGSKPPPPQKKKTYPNWDFWFENKPHLATLVSNNATLTGLSVQMMCNRKY
jgi:hypothetical protein